jgi:hypothetical protein
MFIWGAGQAFPAAKRTVGDDLRLDRASREQRHEQKRTNPV